jgi:hypothetical protein
MDQGGGLDMGVDYYTTEIVPQTILHGIFTSHPHKRVTRICTWRPVLDSTPRLCPPSHDT